MEYLILFPIMESLGGKKMAQNGFVSFQHVFRELNEIADNVSKEVPSSIRPIDHN